MDLKNLHEVIARVDSDASFRNDAVVSAYVGESLNHVEQRLYEYDFPLSQGRSLVDMIPGVSPGAQSYNYDLEKQVGQAQVTDDYASDSPAVDMSVGRFSAPITAIRTHFNYSVQDMRNAVKSGYPLETRKAFSAAQAIERKIDELMATGDASLGVTGVLNNSNVNAQNAADPGGGTEWSNKTPDQRIADVVSAIGRITDATKGVSGEVVDVVLPNSQYDLLALERVADLGMTALSYLRAAVPRIRSITPWHRCAGAGAGSTDRMVVYTKSLDNLGGLLPLEMYVHPAEARSLTWRVELEARCGGVIMYKPLTVEYVDAI